MKVSRYQLRKLIFESILNEGNITEEKAKSSIKTLKVALKSFVPGQIIAKFVKDKDKLLVPPKLIPKKWIEKKVYEK